MYKLQFIGLAAVAGIVVAGGNGHATQPTQADPTHQTHRPIQAKPAGLSRTWRGAQRPSNQALSMQPDRHITKAPGVTDTSHM